MRSEGWSRIEVPTCAITSASAASKSQPSESQKDDHDKERDAFAAVVEGMVAREPERLSRSEG